MKLYRADGRCKYKESETGGGGVRASQDKQQDTDLIMEENNEPEVYENHGQDSRIKEVGVVPQLNAKAGTGGGNLPPVKEGVCAWSQNGCGELFDQQQQFMSLATNANAGGRGTAKIREGATVRRLTPTECERLQGFPDGYTAIPYRNKPASDCPDGPRYKALGNSWAVPCARWIMERIQKVDDRISAELLKDLQ